MPRRLPSFAAAGIASVLLAGMAGCAASDEPPAGSSGDDPAPGPVEDPVASEFADSWLATAAEQFAKSQDPEPSFSLSSETAVEFVFPDGSAGGTDARSDCQIAMIAIGEEYELTMTYPDGSVLCSNILG